MEAFLFYVHSLEGYSLVCQFSMLVCMSLTPRCITLALTFLRNCCVQLPVEHRHLDVQYNLDVFKPEFLMAKISWDA